MLVEGLAIGKLREGVGFAVVEQADVIAEIFGHAISSTADRQGNPRTRQFR